MSVSQKLMIKRSCINVGEEDAMSSFTFLKADWPELYEAAREA